MGQGLSQGKELGGWNVTDSSAVDSSFVETAERVTMRGRVIVKRLRLLVKPQR